MRNAIAGLVFLGCHASSGPQQPSASAAIPPVTLCRTTEAELHSALGEPTRNGMYHNARIMSWILGERSGVVRYLAVLLDENQVVVDRVWDIPTEIPWIPTNQCAASSQ